MEVGPASNFKTIKNQTILFQGSSDRQMHGDHKSSKHRELMEKVKGDVKDIRTIDTFFAQMKVEMSHKDTYSSLHRLRPSNGSQCRRKEMLKILRDRPVH